MLTHTTIMTRDCWFWFRTIPVAHTLLPPPKRAEQDHRDGLQSEKGEAMGHVVSFSNKRDKEKVQQGQSEGLSTPPILHGSDEPIETSEKSRSSFEDIARKNRENQDRIRREREKANKNVLRSYRIK